MKKRGSIRDFKSDLAAFEKHGSLHLFVYGSCEYLTKLALGRFKATCDQAGVATACSLEAATVDEEQWASLMDQPAFFEPASLYVLKRCEQAKQLLKLVQQMKSAGNSLNRACFLFGGDAPPVALKNALAKAGIPMVACLEPWPNEIPPLVQDMAKELALPLTGDAVDLLVAASGTDLTTLANELRKLALILDGEAGPFSAKLVAPHLGMLREDDAFELANLLLARQWSKAHALAGALLERGESALALIGIIANHCRNAARIAAGAPQTEIRLPPSVYKSYAKACYRQDPAPFAKALERCRQVEMLLKSSRVSEELMLASVIDALA